MTRRPSGVGHNRKALTRNEIRRIEVSRNRRAPLRVVKFRQSSGLEVRRRDGRHSGVLYDDVETLPTLHGTRDQRCRRFLLCEVTDNAVYFGPQPAQFERALVNAIGRRRNQHTRTHLSKQARSREPHAIRAARARDQRRTTREVEFGDHRWAHPGSWPPRPPRCRPARRPRTPTGCGLSSARCCTELPDLTLRRPTLSTPSSTTRWVQGLSASLR